MSDPFRPTYFHDFYNKYPSEREALKELNRDMWAEEEHLIHRLVSYNVVTLGGLSVYTILKGPLPFLRKYGKIFGTHRILRQYALLSTICSFVAIQPYWSKWSKTEAKLKEIDEYRVRTEGEYVEPYKPISYSFKHY